MWFKVVLLALSLSQMGLGTAQECDGVAGIFAAVLKQGVSTNSGNQTCVTREELSTTLEKVVDDVIEKRLAAAVEEVITNLTTCCQQQVSPVTTQYPPGSTPSYPAASCWEIKNLNPSASSGYYWLRGTDGSAFRMYCDMDRSCKGVAGGWMRVADIDMTDNTTTCPEGLKLLTTPKRLCAKNMDGGGCSSAVFNLNGIRYTNVCGKVIGYQQRSPDGMGRYSGNQGLTIDDTYMDGVSLTHGSEPRKHIWTFVAALHEVTTSFRYSMCPCTNVNNTVTIPIPPYMGNDYFCDTASESTFEYKFYPDDPLWDGQGCGRPNTCCSFNNPPWFMKELPSSTADDIEMRLCGDEGRSNEDMPVEIVELYVQ